MSETLEKVENIIKRTDKMNVEKLSKDKNALSEDSPLMKLLMESVKLGWKMIYTLPDLDENEMNKVVKKMLDDDKVRNLKIPTEIRTKAAKMIDKVFKIKKNANSSNKTKKMVGGDPHEECPICMEQI